MSLHDTFLFITFLADVTNERSIFLMFLHVSVHDSLLVETLMTDIARVRFPPAAVYHNVLGQRLFFRVPSITYGANVWFNSAVYLHVF